jgi:hypothetical protein
MLFFSILVRKFLVHGLTAGALKGLMAPRALTGMLCRDSCPVRRGIGWSSITRLNRRARADALSRFALPIPAC